jgi:hypothetical protein
LPKDRTESIRLFKPWRKSEKVVLGILESVQRIHEGDAKEEDSENNRQGVELFLNAAAGAVNVAVTTKSQADAGTPGLQKDGSSKKNGEDELDDIENHIAKRIPDGPSFVKPYAILWARTMPDEPLPPIEPISPPPGRNSRLLQVVIFILVLGVVLFFGFKVLGYYRKIQTGLLDTSTLSFESTTASPASLMALAKSAPGSGQLATTDDPSLGSPGAKLTIVEFADFGCPFSREESYVVRALAQKFPNDIQVIYRDYPLVDLHPGADLAAEAGECAQEQGKFWEYHDVLYRHTG